MNERATVYVIDDDPVVRDALTLLLEQEDLSVESFDSGEAFLAICPPRPHSCAIVDIRMPRMDGLQLQAELARRHIALPLIFLTGHGDIPMSVRAIKAGAIDFLTKPVMARELRESLRVALRESERRDLQDEERRAAQARLSQLTQREREVMHLAIQGQANKEIARHLGISHRTVEIHRSRIRDKTGASTLLELADLADKTGSPS